MAKRLQEYVKYTKKELDLYTQTGGSCVSKVNTNLHLSMGPFCLADFKHVLMAHLTRSKVGFYDIHLDGIVLDVKNIKVLGTTGAMRADDPRIHININADVYIFKPEEGAVLSGVVKHIGPLQVGVILYRVFNANVRVSHKVDKDEVQMDQEVKFRIRKYNLQNIFPYIDGELLTPGAEKALAKGKKIIFNTDDNGDSGIEEKDGVQELDKLLSIIKTEEASVFEDSVEGNYKKKKSKNKKDGVQELDKLFPIIKTEAASVFGDSVVENYKKKKSKKFKESSEDDSAILESSADTSLITDKSSKKRKSSNSTISSSKSTEDLSSFKKIKKELTFSGDAESTPSKHKNIKKEKISSPTKKHKSINSSVDFDVKIKHETEDD